MKKFIKIYPKCHPYDYSKDRPTEDNFIRQKNFTYTATGYLMPCCWCDQPEEYDHFKQLGFFDESLKLENNDSVEQIMLSKTWMQFHKTLVVDPSNAPNVCKRKCGTGLIRKYY